MAKCEECGTIIDLGRYTKGGKTCSKKCASIRKKRKDIEYMNKKRKKVKDFAKFLKKNGIKKGEVVRLLGLDSLTNNPPTWSYDLPPTKTFTKEQRTEIKGIIKEVVQEMAK